MMDLMDWEALVIIYIEKAELYCIMYEFGEGVASSVVIRRNNRIIDLSKF